MAIKHVVECDGPDGTQFALKGMPKDGEVPRPPGWQVVTINESGGARGASRTITLLFCGACRELPLPKRLTSLPD